MNAAVIALIIIRTNPCYYYPLVFWTKDGIAPLCPLSIEADIPLTYFGPALSAV